MKTRTLALCLVLPLALPLPAAAQTGPATNDPHAMPQGPDAPRRADTFSQGVAAQAEARAECRTEASRRERRECAREAKREFDEDKSRGAQPQQRPTLRAQ